MADFKKYDARLETLVTETRTNWSPECPDLPRPEQARLAGWLHAHADQATDLLYERMHTGFCRTITVTPADLERWTQSPPT